MFQLQSHFKTLRSSAKAISLAWYTNGKLWLRIICRLMMKLLWGGSARGESIFLCHDKWVQTGLVPVLSVGKSVLDLALAM